MHGFEVRVRVEQGFAESRVEGVDGAVSLSDLMPDGAVAIDFQFDRGLGERLRLSGRFDVHPVMNSLELRLVTPRTFFDEQIE